MKIVLLLCNILLAIVQALIAIRAVRKLRNNIVDFSAVFALVHIIWFFPVVYDVIMGRSVFLYVYKIVRDFDTTASLEMITYYNAMATFIIVMFDAGYSVNRKKTSYSFVYSVRGGFKIKHYYIVQAVILTTCLFLVYRTYRNYGTSLQIFFSAARKKGLYSSFYEKNFIILLPLVLLTNYVIKQMYFQKNIGFGVVPYLLIILLSTIPTGQRREIINDALFAAILIILGRNSIKASRVITRNAEESQAQIAKTQTKKIIKRTRKIIIVILTLAILAIPYLWYQRTIMSHFQDTGYYKVNDLRSIMELLFGSGASGYPTLLAIHNYEEANHVSFFLRNVLFFLQSPIPSKLIGEMKLAPVTELMQQTYDTSGNLSLFYIGDIYFTFSVLSPIVSFFVGFFLERYYNRSLTANNVRYLVYAVILFSQLVTLYKNGLAEYLIKILFMGVLFIIDFSLVNPRGGRINLKVK